MNSGRFSFFAALMAAILVAAQAGAGEEPTHDEQFLIYELNRARNDPAGWASEVGLDLLTGGDGQLATLAGVSPRPPLAVNETLVETARYRASDMASHNYFSHQNHDGRWPHQVVRDIGYALPFQYYDEASLEYQLPDAANYIEAIDLFRSTPLEVLIEVIRDSDPAVEHRRRFLGIEHPIYLAFREVGAGYAYDSSANFDHYWALHLGFEQAGAHAQPSDPLLNFITGVVFNDANDNDRYDSGEGLSGVRVTIGASEDVTNTAGGYAIAVADGSHTVNCSGGDFAGNSSVNVAISGENREVDFLSGEPGAFVDFTAVPEPSLPLLLVGALMTLGALRRLH